MSSRTPAAGIGHAIQCGKNELVEGYPITGIGVDCVLIIECDLEHRRFIDSHIIDRRGAIPDFYIVRVV